MFIRLVLFLNFFLVASVAHADPISAIGLVISGVQAIASGASVLGLIVRAALGLGLSLLQQTLNRQKNKQSSTGSVLEIKMGDDQPMTFPVGSRAVGGRRKYIGSWGKAGGTPNAYLTDVIEISSLPSYAGPFGISSLWVGQQKCGVLWDRPNSDGRGYPVQQFIHPDGTEFMWIKYYDGTQTEADPFLVSKFGNHPDRPYGSDRIGRGCQYVIVTTRLDNDLQLGGSPPEILVEPHPTPLYDPRKDSTNGGSGSHRYGDWTTYEPTLNPMVVAYNIVRGIYYTPDEWVFGGQNVAAIRVPNASWFAAMNECDRDNGSGVAQYRCGLEIQCDQEPLDVIEDLRIACAGRLAEVGGMIKPLVGAPGSAVYSFDDSGIIVTEEQDFEPFPSLTSTHNSISGTYPEPEQRWTVTDAPEARNLDQEAEDGQRSLPAPVRFDAVPYSDQVQHLMKTMSAEQRRFRIHTLTLPPDAWALEPNDVTSWTSSRNSYSNKKFLVTAITGSSGMLQRVTLLEIDPTDYDPPTFYVPAPNGWIGQISAPSQPMQGWTVEPATIKDAAGTPRRPAIKVSCDSDLDDVNLVWVTVRVKATGAVVFDSSSAPYADPYSWILSGDWCLPATDYQVRGKLVPFSNRLTLFSEWLDVTTPDTRLSFVDLSADIVTALNTLQSWINDELPDQILANAQAILDEAQARADAIAAEQSERVAGALEASTRYRDLVREIASIRDYAADLANEQYDQKEQLRQTLTTRIGDVVASFTDQITVAVSANSALALRVTSLEADTGSIHAQITQVDQARADGDQALADRMSLLSAGTDNQFDPAAGSLWTFDTTVMGWTGNGNPTVANGFLRPANQAADPYVLSPTGLAISGNVYRQVRARIRMTGVPAWEGLVWWKSASDAGWDVSRQLVHEAPAFDLDGIALLTFNMPWSGTVDQIRIDLSSAQSATDYFEFDWIAIGSPSPGASRAELAAEQQARASGDSANAQSITQMQAQLTTTNGTVQANSTAIGSLQSSVTSLGNTQTAQGQALTALTQTVAGKASIDSVDQLSGKIDAMGGPDGVASIGQSVRAIRNTLLPQSMEGVEQDFANFLDKMNGQSALSLVSQTLTSQITLTQSSLDILSQAVTQVQATLPGLATSTALTALTSRVTVNENAITVTSNAVTALQAALPGKADATALQSLSQTVTQQGNTITSQGNAITSLQNSVENKADASAVTSLQTTVNQQGDQITAAANAVTEVSASVGEVSADAKFRMEVVNGPNGFTRIGAQARYDSGSGYKSAGWYIQVPSDPNAPAGFYVTASQFGFIDNGSVPFAVSGGITYLVNANIQYATIGSLQVGTSNISGGACTAMGVGRVAGTQTIGANATVNLVSCTVNVEGDGRVVIDAMTLGQYNQNGGSQNAQPIGCNIFRDGQAIFSQTYYLGIVQTVVSGTGGSNGSVTQTTYTAGWVGVSGLYDAPGPGNHTYTMQIYCPGNTIGWNESNITATAYKR